MTPYQHYWRKPRVRFARGQFWRLHPGGFGAMFPSGPYATLEHAFHANDYFHATSTIEAHRRLTGFEAPDQRLENVRRWDELRNKM